MALVAAHDDVRAGGGSHRKVFVIFRIAALLDCLGWFDPLRREHHDVENALAPFDCDETFKLRSENNLAKLILDRLRKK